LLFFTGGLKSMSRATDAEAIAAAAVARLTDSSLRDNSDYKFDTALVAVMTTITAALSKPGICPELQEARSARDTAAVRNIVLAALPYFAKVHLEAMCSD